MKKIALSLCLLVNFTLFANNETEIQEIETKNNKIENKNCSVTVTFSRGGRTVTETYNSTSSSAGGCAIWESNLLESIEKKGYKIDASSSNYQTTLSLQKF